jgi:hypothetical protein
MRKHTVNDVFLAVAIGGCIALLSPRPDADAIDQGSPATADATVLSVTAGHPESAGDCCPEPSRRRQGSDPAQLASKAVRGIEMPYFSFGGTHRE